MNSAGASAGAVLARERPYAVDVNLIGRRSELAAVVRLLDRAAAGAGDCLVLTGPSGAGKTALADAAAELARSREIPVLRTTDGTEALTQGGPRLLLVEDVDEGDAATVAFLAQLASSATALLVTAQRSIGFGREMRLRSLTEAELATLLPDGLPSEAVHAVWLLSGGWPGPALAFGAELADLDAPLVHLALTTPSRAQFLDVDAGLLRLLEAAAENTSTPPIARARVLARLARELLGDASAAARRRVLIEEAESLAREAGDPGVLAEVLDSRLHALWDPAAARERLTTASEIVENARRGGGAVFEERGLFWRFVALAELGDLAAAETALAAYARAGELAGDAEAAVVVLARQAMLATVRGRFETAAELAAQVAVRARQVEQLDAADRAGDVERAAAIHSERVAVLGELRRTGGLGGRPRVHSSEAERARVNATRALWAAVARVEAVAPLAGAHLRASLRSGSLLRYQPAPGGPVRWRV